MVVKILQGFFFLKKKTLIVQNGTWELVPPTPHKTLFIANGFFHTKHYSNDSINKFKVCLVVKDFHQRPRVNYHDTFNQWLNLPLCTLFSVYQLVVGDFFVNLMLIMLSCKVILLRMCIWHNHRILLTLTIPLMCVNFVRSSMGSSKLHVLATRASPIP